MPRLIWLKLTDGRSVVAGCASTRSTIVRALAHPDRTLTLTSDDSVESIQAGSVRRFMVFEAVKHVPPSTAVYRMIHV